MVGERRCISCHRLANRREFWRVVRTCDGQVSLDRGMGRSAYICPVPECVAVAQKKKRLSKALRTSIPESIFSELLARF